MADHWHDPAFAREWDRSNGRANPITALIDQYCAHGERVLDLGIGTGLVESNLLARRPDLRVDGVDASDAMLELASERLGPMGDAARLIRHDLADVATLVLPEVAYPAVISVQVLHHLPHDRQREVIRFAWDTLRPGGLFILMERLRIDAERHRSVYAATLAWLGEASGRAGEDTEAFFTRLASKEDYPATLDEAMEWLREAGFAAACLHLMLDRAVLGGGKPIGQ